MKFYKYCCSCLLLIFITGCTYRLQPLYVDLGAASTVLPRPAANTCRLFIDRVGSIYPSIPLPRATVNAAGYRLDSLFVTNDSLQKALLTNYGVDDNGDRMLMWQKLQQAIAASIVNQINTAAKGCSSITVLIHGIGNDINQDNRLNRNPYEAFRTAENKIDGLLQLHSKKTFYVEVYWDALHRVKRTDFVAVFAGAGANAYYAGLALRTVVSHLQCDSLIVLTHSLGAKVGCQLLFNLAVPHKQEVLNRCAGEGYTDTMRYATPPQKTIRLGIVVPAIPGKSTFASFYQRTGQAAPASGEKDRYAVWVGYNNKDRVITKNIISQFYSPLLVRYVGSSTALGALQSENKKVARLFASRYPQSSFTAIDFQDSGGEQSPQTAHYFSNYCNNQQFPVLVKALYGL